MLCLPFLHCYGDTGGGVSGAFLFLYDIYSLYFEAAICAALAEIDTDSQSGHQRQKESQWDPGGNGSVMGEWL